MNGREKTLEAVNDACIQQFDIKRRVYDGDLLSGERGPSFISLAQITNWKTIDVRFVERTHDDRRPSGGKQGRQQQKTHNEPASEERKTAFSSAIPSTKTMLDLDMFPI